MTKTRFRTPRFNEHAERAFGRLRDTTLRKTGLEKAIGEATGRNLSVLEASVPREEFAAFKEWVTPDAVWKEVEKRGLASDSRAKRIVTMSLGNPSAYEGYPPNSDLYRCLGEITSEQIRESSGYTTSFGYPPLLGKMKRANFFDPTSIHNDPAGFSDVRVYLTTGSSTGVELAVAPMLLTSADTLLVPDWTYVIHLAAGYKRNAHVENWELRDDGRPDPGSLRAKLIEEKHGDRNIQAVVLTPIGNPVGAAMTRADIVEHLRIVQEATEREGRPLLTLVDVAYEPFRRDGKPLDPIKIAKEEGLHLPIAVLDTTSKGYGMSGWRMGKLGILWPSDAFPDYREDYLTALENAVLPTLGLVGVPMQMAFDRLFTQLATDEQLMSRTVEFFRTRRELINANLLYMAKELSKIDGVYLSRYYDHGGTNGGIEPEALSSFYLLFGFTKLATREGSGFNQVVAFGEYALDTPGVAMINCVPGQSFLPSKRISLHQGLIRVTGLTNNDETEAFLESVRAYARHLD